MSIFLLGTKQLKSFKMNGGGKPFSNWKLNDKHNLTVLVKRGRYFSSSKEGGGEEKFKSSPEFLEVVFML